MAERVRLRRSFNVNLDSMFVFCIAGDVVVKAKFGHSKEKLAHIRDHKI